MRREEAIMNSTSNFAYDVFVNDPPPQDNGLLPNGEPKGGSPVASTLIYGSRDAVLTDPGFTADQAGVLGDWLAGKDRNLTDIFITHGHGDHWFAAGLLADRFGARNTLLIGVVGFAVASAVGGAAVDGAMLITARAVQGAFAAMLVSSTKSLLVNVYTDGQERARAIGIFTATLTAGLAVGLVLGGVLTSALNWRWCLYVNIPLSLVAVLGAPRVLPALPGRPEIRIDVASAVLASAGMVALIYGLGEASVLAWGSGQVTGSLIAAAVLLGGFVARQVGRPDRLLPLRVVLDRNRGWGMIALIVNALSTFGMLLILTYQLQSVMRYSALATGLALVPFAAAAGLGSAVLAPWLMARVAPRWLVSGSIVIEAAGLVPLIWLTPASRYLPLILAATLLLVVGIASASIIGEDLRNEVSDLARVRAAADVALGKLKVNLGLEI